MSNAIDQIKQLFCNEPKTIVKELEFRNEDGKYMFSIVGEHADHWYGKLLMVPELNKKTMNIEGKGEFIVLEAVAFCGYKVGGFIGFNLNKGGYIKVITK